MSQTENGSIDRKTDRRKKPTPFLSRYTFTGKRRFSRRDDEKLNYYVDRLDKKTWLAIFAIIILSIIDSIFTLYFINRGFKEINPLMNIALIIGKPTFIITKAVLTVSGILALALHKNFKFVKILVSILICFYILLNLYHIWLFIN